MVATATMLVRLNSCRCGNHFQFSTFNFYKMSYIISGIQQMGVGVKDADTAWTWYRRYFGADIPIFEERAEAWLADRPDLKAEFDERKAADPDFAKNQLILIMREWYMAPSGQIPAYEWNFGDVNPPVQAWASLQVYQMEKKKTGKGDLIF